MYSEHRTCHGGPAAADQVISVSAKWKLCSTTSSCDLRGRKWHSSCQEEDFPVIFRNRHAEVWHDAKTPAPVFHVRFFFTFSFTHWRQNFNLQPATTTNGVSDRSTRLQWPSSRSLRVGPRCPSRLFLRDLTAPAAFIRPTYREQHCTAGTWLARRWHSCFIPRRLRLQISPRKQAIPMYVLCVVFLRPSGHSHFLQTCTTYHYTRTRAISKHPDPTVLETLSTWRHHVYFSFLTITESFSAQARHFWRSHR
jgi:hypothetical protein